MGCQAGVVTRESGVNFPEGPGLEDELDSSSCVELSQEQITNFKECVTFACLLSWGSFFSVMPHSWTFLQMIWEVGEGRTPGL